MRDLGIATLERALEQALVVVADLTALIKEARRTSGLRSEPSDPPDRVAIESGAMTMNEFCERYRINRATLYHMRRDGTGPEVLMVGRKVLITYRAAHEWEQQGGRS